MKRWAVLQPFDGQISCYTGLSGLCLIGDDQHGPSNVRMSSDRDTRRSVSFLGRALIMRAIKCLKGVRWMPWRAQAMKDVVRCDKPWGAANKL